MKSQTIPNSNSQSIRNQESKTTSLELLPLSLEELSNVSGGAAYMKLGDIKG